MTSSSTSDTSSSVSSASQPCVAVSRRRQLPVVPPVPVRARGSRLHGRRGRRLRRPLPRSRPLLLHSALRLSKQQRSLSETFASAEQPARRSELGRRLHI